jgi:hypothetical protein
MISLSSPLVLLACLCALVPLILHFLGRATAANFSFPALRFLRAAAVKTARRRKIENVTLLACRMGLFTLLPLALALPFFRPKAANFMGGKNLALAIVLDNTASMNQLVKGQPAFELAKFQALRLLRGSDTAQPPELALLLCPVDSAPIVTSNLTQLSDRIRTMKPSGVETDLTATIRQAEALLNDQNSPNKLIYVLTDLQKSGLHPDRLNTVKIPLAILDLAEPGDNLGITEVKVSNPVIAGKPIAFSVQLDGSLSAPRNIAIKLMSEKNEILHTQDFLYTHSPLQPIFFEVTLPKPGPFAGFLELTFSDSLPLDNRYFFAFQVNPPIPVQICTTLPPQQDWAKDPAFFLSAALNAPGWITPRVSGKIANDVNVIYFPQSSSIDAKALERFLKKKEKAAVIFSSLETSCPVLETFGYGKIISIAETETPFPVEQTDTAEPLIASLGFKSSIYRQLAVTRYAKFRPADGTAPLLVLSSGDPLLVKRNNLFFFTSPPQLTYGTLPLNPVFPAILAQIAADTVPDESASTVRAGQTFTITAATLKPGPNQITLFTPGLYQFQNRPLAVNCSPETVDLTPCPLTDFAHLPNVFAANSPAALETDLSKLAQGKPLWDTLLFIVLLILLAETLLANLRKPANPHT